ncbi:MAG: hypothetical protein HRU76_00100 [Phycisphaeraceae bacterium]|nr:hypothetical protein [Phycisphaerales bacterium]QOJ16094.1 MAG: hypothetical protein HRU76_00100 [Phycisphaeraceae bacterium]
MNPDSLRADTLPDVLTAVEAATYLRLIEDADGHPRDMADAVKSLDHLCEAHGLPSVRIGKARRFVTAQVQTWLETLRGGQPVAATIAAAGALCSASGRPC